MNLTEQAIEYHKALHGEDPQYLPYRNASDTPFRGIPIETMNELVNQTEVKRELRAFKKKLKEDSEQPLKVGSLVRNRRSRSRDIKQGVIVKISDENKWALVADTYTLDEPLTRVRSQWVHINNIKPRVADPAERDQINIIRTRTQYKNVNTVSRDDDQDPTPYTSDGTPVWIVEVLEIGYLVRYPSRPNSRYRKETVCFKID